MRLQTLLSLPELRLELIWGHPELDREVSWAVVTDLLDPGQYLSGGELVITGLVWRRTPADSEHFVEAAARVPVTGIAAGVADSGDLPDDLVGACRSRRVPLFRVPPEVAFHTVAEQVARRVSAARSADLASVLGRHRQLVSTAVRQAAGTPSAVAEGLRPVLELVQRDLGLPCWVLTPTGGVVAGTQELSRRVRERAVAAYLAGERGSSPGRSPLSLFDVTPTRRGDAGRLAGWILAVDDDHREWSAERRHLVNELLALITAEYAQLEQRLAADRPLADELVRLVTADALPGELLPHLRACGLDAQRPTAVVAASGPPYLRTVLEDVLASSAPGSQVGMHPEGGSTTAVAFVPLGDGDSTDTRESYPSAESVATERVVLEAAEPTAEPTAGIIAEAGTSGELGEPEARETVATLRRELAALEDGVGRDRLRIGISGTVTADGLRAALDEAVHASRLAGLRGSPVAIVGHEELDTHMLLLAAAPDEVRREFQRRVLGPLFAYDRRHGTELVRTLRSYLEHTGSWASCASDLHVHVNTLRYRISRVEQLTGRNLRRLEDQVDFFLALEV